MKKIHTFPQLHTIVIFKSTFLPCHWTCVEIMRAVYYLYSGAWKVVSENEILIDVMSENWRLN
jgi:hypothetical protein